jgi:hypothetical protein
MIRIVCLCLFTAAMVAAQNPSAPPTPAALEQTVKDRTAEFNKLSQGLEAALNRLLPCDPKIAAAIGQVLKASDARIAAITAYLGAANRQAALQTTAARQVATSAQGLGADLAAEKSDLVPERAAVDGQLANLSRSAQRRGSLAAPQDALKQVVAVQKQRSDTVDSAVGYQDATGLALADLVVQLQARQAAWSDIQTAFEAEGTRWSAYYAARQARAQIECTISRGAAAAATKGKQK